MSREKKLLVSSEDYGRDLTGVQNLRKKHKRLEAELAAHEPAIQVRDLFRPRRWRGLHGPWGRAEKSFALIHFAEAYGVYDPSFQTWKKVVDVMLRFFLDASRSR